MTIRTALVPVAEIFDLRRSVLRPGFPPEDAVFPEDALPDSFHVAAYDEDGALTACVTFFPEAFPERTAPMADAPAYRFRGMASAPAVRGRGHGAAVLRAGLDRAAEQGARLVWCNGRTSARGFYERQGFTAVGEEFDLPPIGPHHVFAITVGGAGDGSP
ncbi:GNAT family N-acetyltransferase [Streptomyces mashuensis]|nr:GNAT family N-acetyltransferase [Streptomyces mashuensis]